jgi:hypothetical protein
MSLVRPFSVRIVVLKYLIAGIRYLVTELTFVTYSMHQSICLPDIDTTQLGFLTHQTFCAT